MSCRKEAYADLLTPLSYHSVSVFETILLTWSCHSVCLFYTLLLPYTLLGSISFS